MEKKTVSTYGRVGKLEDRAAAVDIRLASRADSCPLVAAVSADIANIKAVQTADSATTAATTAANKSWTSALSPVVYAILGAGAMLVLSHGPAILAAIK